MKNQSNKDTSIWGSSLKSFPWDENDDISTSQALISSTVLEWYDAKHRRICNDEVKFINSIEVKNCPICCNYHFIKKGFYSNGIQRYKCSLCGKYFNPLTNTIFEDYKIPISEWIEYLIHLFEFHSITSSARDNRNAYSTGRYWLFKVFSVLKDIQDNIVLEGDVYLDEMFFSVIKKDTEKTKDNKSLRGISRNKLCVVAAYDSNNLILLYEHTSKPSEYSTLKYLRNHIKPGSHLIHDGEKSHLSLIKELNLSETFYKSDTLKDKDDKDNPLDPINNIHDLSKRFMKAHGGYNRDNLQDWMNLIWFILSKPINRYEKIDKFINLALSSPKRVKYRDVMSKKDLEINNF